jgi:phosphatidylserine/phosphatidylglycerophosphate/cardiolipin synthase-like enzyme
MLEKQHENIKVLRHPATLISMWSHHEKICVIDQQRAFVGGIDLCMGRYDTPEHPLKDWGDEDGNYLFPGKDFSNSRTKDFLNVADTKEELINRRTDPRMPWQDLHMFISGESAQDLGVHFIEHWNNAKTDVEGTKDKQGAFLRPVENLNDSMSKHRGRHIDGSVDDLLDFDDGEEYGIIGKDYIEYIVDDADEEFELDKGNTDMGKPHSFSLF